MTGPIVMTNTAPHAVSDVTNTLETVIGTVITIDVAEEIAVNAVGQEKEVLKEDAALIEDVALKEGVVQKGDAPVVGEGKISIPQDQELLIDLSQAEARAQKIPTVIETGVTGIDQAVGLLMNVIREFLKVIVNVTLLTPWLLTHIFRKKIMMTKRVRKKRKMVSILMQTVTSFSGMDSSGYLDSDRNLTLILCKST